MSTTLTAGSNHGRQVPFSMGTDRFNILRLNIKRSNCPPLLVNLIVQGRQLASGISGRDLAGFRELCHEIKYEVFLMNVECNRLHSGKERNNGLPHFFRPLELLVPGLG
jgi:hypothetical protein